MGGELTRNAGLPCTWKVVGRAAAAVVGALLLPLPPPALEAAAAAVLRSTTPGVSAGESRAAASAAAPPAASRPASLSGFSCVRLGPSARCADPGAWAVPVAAAAAAGALELRTALPAQQRPEATR